jgi:hypothetical protein
MSRPDRVDLKQDFAAVRRVLFNEWNPVGVNGLPEDEYDSYVWPLVRLLRDGGDAATLTRHLHEVEQFYFSRDTSEEKLLPVAASLLALGIGKESA